MYNLENEVFELFEESTDLALLNELYVGETKFISDLIQAVSEARRPYVGRMQRPIRGDRNLLKIGDMIAREFGFHGVSFMVPFNTSLNAFTHPVTTSFDKPVRSLKPKYNPKVGMSMNPIDGLCVIIAVTSAVWFNAEFTDREVTAAILHEVGHSFVIQSERIIPIVEAQRLVTVLMAIYNALIGILTANLNGFGTTKQILFSTNSVKVIKHSIQQAVDNNPLFSGIVNLQNWVEGVAMQIMKEVSAVMRPYNALAAIPSALYETIMKMLLLKGFTDSSRSQEYLSDSFAAMYGLGPEITSFLTKIEYNPSASGSVIENITNRIPIIGAINQSLYIPILMITHSVAAHPSTVARTKKLIAELEKELKDSDLSASTKKAVQNDIKELEKNLDALVDADRRLSSRSDAASVKAAWFAYLNQDPNYSNNEEEYYTDIDHRNKNMKESSRLLLDLEDFEVI